MLRLRFAFDAIEEKEFNNTVIAVDEFHHVSAEGTNRLGNVLKSIMQKSNAHVVAMTGSYFRGDSIPILLPEVEAQFIKVKYDYYEQLNGYEHLKSLGIGYHFYQQKYTSALHEVLDENKKTIIHIPSVNSGESTKDKIEEVGKIIETIGELEYQDPETGVLNVRSSKSNKLIKVADLVNDDQRARDRISNYLRQINSADDIDIIIALGMAKEGFDWPYCEQALTVGYRGSLTEIIQIIGRATRDSENKTHAQFTNLIAQPDAEDDEVKLSVNNMLKAISASLLMEQVLAPNFKFKAKYPEEENSKNEYDEGNDKINKVNEEENTIKIRGFKEPSTAKVEQIIESDLNDLKANILQDDKMLKSMPNEKSDPEVINKVLIPKIIKETYPELSDEEVEEVRQHVVVDSVIKNGDIEDQGDKRFIKMADTFVNIDEIHIDLIDSVNPFQKAFEILSKSVTAPVLRTIQETIDASRIQMTEDEAVILWPKIKSWVERTGRNPDIKSLDPKEKRYAETIVFLKQLKRKREQNG